MRRPILLASLLAAACSSGGNGADGGGPPATDQGVRGADGAAPPADVGSSADGGTGGGGDALPQDAANAGADAGIFHGPSPTGLASLSGIVYQSTGHPLKGVMVIVEGPANRIAMTDDHGQFIIPELATGTKVIRFDGSTATGDPGTIYGTLRVLTSIGSGGASKLPQLIVLPNLADPMGAKDLGVTVSATGATTRAIHAETGPVRVTGQSGTVIHLDGAPAAQPVDIAAVPVPLLNLPMPLPAQANTDLADFVTIQPPNATFDPPLSIQIPNTQGLPAGMTGISIWSFDHDLESWENRSLETGHYGTVDPTGMFIVATGVIVKGGWHGPAGPPPFPPTCAIGRAVDQNGVALGGVYVFTNGGQSRTTAPDGTFSICGVARDPVTIRITAPVELGGTRTSTTQPAVRGGMTNFGTIVLTIPTTGALSGTAQNLGQPSAQPILIQGPMMMMATIHPSADGSFFLTGLPEGMYSASTTFTGDSSPTSTSFSITRGETTVILLQKAVGGATLAVRALLVPDDISMPAMVANATTLKATVTLTQGMATVSQDTDAQGLAMFNGVGSGPLLVTGAIDFIDMTGAHQRYIASEVLDAPPASGQVGLLLFRFNNGNCCNNMPPPMGTGISGTIVNIPDIPSGYQLEVQANGKSGGGGTSVLSGPVTNPPNQTFTINVSPGSYRLIAQIRRSVSMGMQIQQSFFAAAAVVPREVVVTSGNTTTVMNLDFSDPGMAVAFADKPYTVSGTLQSPTKGQIESRLSLSGVDENYGFQTFQSNMPGFTLPSMGSFVVSAPAAFRVDYRAQLEGMAAQQERQQPAAPGAASIAFDMGALATVTQPTANQSIGAADAAHMTVAWTPPAGASLQFVVLEPKGMTGVAGIDQASWVLIVQPGKSSIALPMIPNMVFGSGATADVGVYELQFSQPFDFAYFETFDIQTHLLNLLGGGYSLAGSAVQISVGP